MLFSLTAALTCDDLVLHNLVGDFLVHFCKRVWSRSIATLVAAPSVLKIARQKTNNK